MLAIETRGLSKSYGGRAVVEELDLHVERGDIYGFVGRNGAGKSTTMKMICGLVRPSAGEVVLFGGTGSADSRFTRIGALVEHPALHPGMSALGNLMCKAIALGIVDAKAECERLLGIVGLGEVGRKRVKSFSLGMRQRLGLALALVGSPDLLLLDEPMNGLDPKGVREVRDLIVRLNQQRGVTVMVSSHVLDQLGRMATRYGVLDRGRMARELTAGEVAEECGDYLVLLTSDQNRALAVLAERLPFARCSVMPDDRIRLSGSVGSIPIDTETIGAIMAGEGIAVRELYPHRRDIEEFFLGLMGGADRA